MTPLIKKQTFVDRLEIFWIGLPLRLLEGTMAIFIAFCIAAPFIGLIIDWIFNGWALSLLWNWFLVPMQSVAVLKTAQGIEIVMIVGFLPRLFSPDRKILNLKEPVGAAEKVIEEKKEVEAEKPKDSEKAIREMRMQEFRVMYSGFMRLHVYTISALSLGWILHRFFTN